MPKHQFNDESGFEIMPAGEVVLEVVNAIEKVSQSGNEMLVVDLVDAQNRRVKDYLVFSPKAAWKIDTFLKSVGLAPKEKGVQIDVTPRLILGARGWAKIEHEPDDKGVNWPRVAAWLKKNESLPARAVASNQPTAPSSPRPTFDGDDDIPF